MPADLPIFDPDKTPLEHADKFVQPLSGVAIYDADGQRVFPPIEPDENRP